MEHRWEGTEGEEINGANGIHLEEKKGKSRKQKVAHLS